MDPGLRRRRRRSGGVSAAEYIVATVLVGITGIIGYQSFGTKVKCKLTAATGLFGGVSGSSGGAVAPECEEPGSAGGSGGSSSPSPGSGDSSGCPNGLCMLPDGCFVAGTPVLTEAGWLPIESVVVGMQVRSRPESDDGAAEWKPVTRTFAHAAKSLVRLTVVDARGGEESLRLTPEHRVHAEGRGWVAAAELVPGRDVLLDADGVPLQLEATESLPDVATVFNFEVADDHTYFVGRHAVWVHNKCKKGDHVFNNGYSAGVFQEAPGDLWNSHNCANNELASALSNIQNNLNQAEGDCQLTVDKDDPTSSDGDDNSKKFGKAKKDFIDAVQAMAEARASYDAKPNDPARRAALDAAIQKAADAGQAMRDEAYDADAAKLVSKQDRDKIDACKKALDEANTRLQQALQSYKNTPAQDGLICRKS